MQLIEQDPLVWGRIVAHLFHFSMFFMLVDLKDGFNFIVVIVEYKWPSRLRPSWFKEAGIKAWVNSSHTW